MMPGDIVRSRYFTKKAHLFYRPEPDVDDHQVGIFNHGLVIAVLRPLASYQTVQEIPVMVIDDTTRQFGWTYASELTRLDPSGMAYFE